MNGVKLRWIINDKDNFDKRLFLRAKYTASWMSVRGATITGTVLAATDYCYFLSVHYNVKNHILQRKCDGCLQTFSVHHTINRSNGGLVISRYYKIRDKIIHLYRQSFSHNCVWKKPLIHQGRSRSEGGRYHRRIITETQGDVLIRGLWEIQTDDIIDVRFIDSDADTYVKEGMDTLLLRWEKIHKDKHGRHCNEQRQHFLCLSSQFMVYPSSTCYFE